MLHHSGTIAVRNRAPAWLFIEPVVHDRYVMVDTFELIASGDLEGLRAELRRDPEIARQRHSSGASPVAWAAYMGNVGAVAVIRAALDQLDAHEAIVLGDTGRLDELIEDGWDPNELSPDGFLPLALAAFFGNEAAFDRLLPLTADVNVPARNRQKVAALHAATARRDTRIVEDLLRAGADPNQPQADDITPLHAAALHGDAAIVALLLLFGADPRQECTKGKTAADYARDGKHDWLVKRLEG